MAVTVLPGALCTVFYLSAPMTTLTQSTVANQIRGGNFCAMTSISFCLIHSFYKYFLIVNCVSGTVCYFPSLPAQQDHGKKHKFLTMVIPPMAFCSFRTSWTPSSSRILVPTGSNIYNGSSYQHTKVGLLHLTLKTGIPQVHQSSLSLVAQVCQPPLSLPYLLSCQGHCTSISCIYANQKKVCIPKDTFLPSDRRSFRTY